METWWYLYRKISVLLPYRSPENSRVATGQRHLPMHHHSQQLSSFLNRVTRRLLGVVGETTLEANALPNARRSRLPSRRTRVHKFNDPTFRGPLEDTQCACVYASRDRGSQTLRAGGRGGGGSRVSGSRIYTLVCLVVPIGVSQDKPSLKNKEYWH